MAHNAYDTLCDFYDHVIDTMEDVNTKLKSSDGKIRPADSGFVKDLSEAAKDLTTTMAMLEHAEEVYPASQEYRGDMSRGYPYDEDTSRARGHRNAPRDARGRFSGSYSREDEMRDMASNIRNRMRDWRDMPEDMRRSAEDFASRLENRM